MLGRDYDQAEASRITEVLTNLESLRTTTTDPEEKRRKTRDFFEDEQNREWATLIADRETLRQSVKRGIKWRQGLLWGALMAFMCAGITFVVPYIISGQQSIPYVIPFFFVIIGTVCLCLRPVLFPIRYEQERIELLTDEIDLFTIQKDEVEKRAEKLFKKHQNELKLYYDVTLSHSRLIFFGGILCLFIGFGIILGTLYFVFMPSPQMAAENVTYYTSNQTETLTPLGNETIVKNVTLAAGNITSFGQKNTDFAVKVIPAVLAAIGTILVNYIAVIFLKMYSQTIKSMSVFHNRLVVSNHLHFSNYLVSKIETQTKREETLATIAIDIAKNCNVTAGAENPSDSDSNAPGNEKKKTA